MKTIGWKELVSFPELGIKDLPVKIDTGARTSVIHCKDMEVFKKGRKKFVRFVLLDSSMELFNGKEFIMPYHKERRVKSSFGQEENRIVINTVIELFSKQHPIELSLRDRSAMEYPMLLGRSFIRKKFLVDVARSNLSAKSKARKEKQK